MLKYKWRFLALGLWLSLSIVSLKGWFLLTALKPGSWPVWHNHNAAACIYGSWPIFTILVLGISVVYLIEGFYHRPASLKTTILWSLMLGLAAVAAYPVGSKDLFGYAAYARLHVYYGLNPYLARVLDVHKYRYDVFLQNMWWIKQSTPYGPLWTWLAALDYRLTAVFGLIPLLLSFKLMALGAHLLNTWMVFRLAELVNPGRGELAAALYGLNPLAIFELAVNGHNDGLAIFLLLVALYLLARGRRSTGFVSVGLANAYKMSVGLLTPFLLWRTASQEGLAAALKSLVLVVSVWLVMYLPFGIGKSIFTGLGNTVDGYLSNSLPILPAFFGYRSLSASFNLFGIVLFIPCYLYLVYLSGKSNWRTLIIASGLGFLAYFALGAVVVHTWYFIMPLALMATVPDSFWTRTVIWQTLLLFVSYILLLALRGMAIDFYTYLIVWLPTLVMAGFWYYRGGKDIIQSMTDRSEQI
jgi:hypothetical protein